MAASEEPWKTATDPTRETGWTRKRWRRSTSPQCRRGYEPEPVRTRLREAAEEIRRLNALVGSLSDRITELESTPPETLESRRVAEALGDEATRVLQSATDAAQVQIERAEAEHARIVGEAEAAAAAIAEEGRERGKSMVVEAQAVRERILADLARRRHEHRVEVEQLRVTRERLLEALDIFRQGLDGWIEELVQAEPRAAAAAEQAGLRVAAQPGVDRRRTRSGDLHSTPGWDASRWWI